MNTVINDSIARYRQLNRRVYFQAVAIVLLFHLLLILMFTIADHNTREKPDVLRKISMLSFDGKKTTLDRNISEWLFCDDPTVMTKPNERHGFGSLCAREPFRLLEDKDKDFKQPLGKTIKIDTFDYISHSPVAATLTNSGVVYASEGVKVGNYPTVGTFPHWSDFAGNELPQLFMDIDKIKFVIDSSPPPIKPTKLKINFKSSGGFVRIKVADSSGRPDLDSLALRTLKGAFRQSGLNKNGDEQYTFITVQWQRAGGKSK